MHILLVQPKMNRRPMDTSIKSRMSPSLALYTIKKLIPPEHQVEVVNENLGEIDFDREVDLVGITVTVDVFNRAADIAAKFRERKITVVAGGIHISADPENCKDYFDAICIGKAEATWPNLLRDFQKTQLKEVYEDDYTGDAICSPDYEAAENGNYLYTNIVSTSRGCPYRCDFCYNSCEKSVPYINRPLEDVLAEIKQIRSNHILFIDDNFIGNREWTRAFLLKLETLNLKWNAAVSVDLVNDPQLMDLMKRSGCRSLFIGFESLNQSALENVHKKQNRVDLFEKLALQLHERGIMINASVVFGLPGDDRSVFRATLDWMVRHKIETVTAHILTPYPGTSLHRAMLERGRIVDFDLSHYNTAHVVYKPENMTANELYEGYLWFYKEFYSLRNIIRRMPEDRKQHVPYLCFSFLYRKFGKFTEILSKAVPLNKLGKFAADISYRLNRQPAVDSSLTGDRETKYQYDEITKR